LTERKVKIKYIYILGYIKSAGYSRQTIYSIRRKKYE